ncbi:MAG: metallophosphoesterase [Candidatus Latescibacterota bacterium]|nr:metallophosphoesterase [Candidatus Latescibacterota bacterium]
MTIRFVVMTDSHYHPTAIRDWGAPKMLTQSGEALETSVPAVNALDADFIIHGGDLVCGGGSFDLPTDEYEHSIRHVAETYGRLQAPIHYVPGNHDCDAQTGSFDSLYSAFTSSSSHPMAKMSERSK